VTLRVAIGRLGAIGKSVARRLDEGLEGLILAAVAARDITRAEAIIDGFARSVVAIWRCDRGMRAGRSTA